jgi:two-component system chemotaxis sensor kinase CheA
VARIGAFARGEGATTGTRCRRPPENAAGEAGSCQAPARADELDGPTRFDVEIGPLEHPSQAGNIVDLFKEIPGLGTIEPVDPREGDPAGLSRFVVASSSAEGELIDLFTFHVAREQVRMTPAGATATKTTELPAGAPAAGFRRRGRRPCRGHGRRGA